MLCWTSKRREQFANAAKDLLLSRYVDMFINFANDPKIREAKDVQPPLERFFNELLPLPYPSRDIRDLRVGKMEYMDSQITDCRSQKIFIFNGITDLSIIYTPLEVSLGGGEIKLSKSELATGPDLNSAGKKAVAQTGTQIVGAVKKLRKLIVNAHPFSMLTTNGWQRIFVRQKLGGDSILYFHHLSLIPFGEREEAGGILMGDDDGEIQKKSLLPKESSGALSESRIRMTVTARHFTCWL